MNMIFKQKQIKALWQELARNENATINIKIRKGEKVNVGFINQFALHDSIPNKWFDWERRVNARVMIIGQDWGPYAALLPYIKGYREGSDNLDEYLFRTQSSRTEKFIIKSIENSFLESSGRSISKKEWDDFIFTIAIFFTRQGKHFRGNEFYDEKYGMKISLPYLKKQIEIVNPKIIMPLGGVAWRMVKEIFDLTQYPDTISNVISELKNGKILINGTTIIPNYHPASYVDPKVQYGIWKKVWGKS